MRRWWWSVLVGVCCVAVPSGPAAAAAVAVTADPSPSSAPVTVAHAEPGKPVCTIQDQRLISLSGMGATASGYVVINDYTGSSRNDRVFFLDKACKVGSRTVTYAGGARDPEDLAVGKDGTVWVADIGDNDKNRSTIGIWKVPANGSQAVLHRLRYPDNKHDAEALLLDANDRPIIVTKETGLSHIFVPTGPLVPASANSQGVPLRKVGEFKPQRTGTATPLAFIGQIQVTGGANSPDRAKVVLRTYSDAYEWDVPDGDVVKAITTGKPRITPLPDEPWGESITYSADGASFLTVSETENLPADELPQILQYSPATTTAKPSTAPGATPPKRNTLSWYQRLSLTQATSLIAGVGIFGVLLVFAGVLGILRARRRGTGRGPTDEDGAIAEYGSREPAGVVASTGYRHPPYDGYADPSEYASGYPPGGYPPGGGAPGGPGPGGGGAPGGSVYGGPGRGGSVHGGGSVYGSGGYGGGTGGGAGGGYDGGPGGYGAPPPSGYPPQRRG